MSIKKLTLIGFSWVVLPLALALLYSVQQVNELAKQGTRAVFNVAELNQANRDLGLTRGKLERFASQFIILQEADLLVSYKQQAELLTIDVANQFSTYEDKALQGWVLGLVEQTHRLSYLLENESLSDLNLSLLKDQFQALSAINQEIVARSNELIREQAKQIEYSANNVSSTMLKSLIIIPLTLVVSGFFIVLITEPMKQLLAKIKHLERGDFEREITISGAPEVQEIADALELMRSRLHALELQKSSFIRHISHELKTPLAAIREGTELIYDNSVGELNRDQSEIVNIIKHSVTRLQKLIEDLLDFNIVLDSTSLQDSESILLEAIIGQSLEDRKLDIKRKNINIELELEPVQLQCNAKQFSVILDNLLSNAVKFSPDGGTIGISSQLKGSNVTLTVSDQGPGIPQDLHQKVFDAFYQGPAPNDQHIKGSGLGLTIVKELLMRLHGDISIQHSSAIDEGASTMSISITLPKAQSVGRGI